MYELERRGNSKRVEIEFDRKEEREHPLLGIEFGGSFVVKTRATLSYEVEPPLFPALTLSLFDPVPPACPPLIVGSRVPFPMLAPCVPACQPASQPASLPAYGRAFLLAAPPVDPVEPRTRHRSILLLLRAASYPCIFSLATYSLSPHLLCAHLSPIVAIV